MLEHPGIARLYESGTVDGPSGPVPWLAMEYVEGQPLDAWAATAPSLHQRVQLLEALCRAVHFAHTRGVVHRDLKPSNILVDAQQQPRIIDFGIATALERGDLTRMTSAGSVLGTLPYMSPEQLDGSASTDPRWDVYALGVIAYELLGGSSHVIGGDAEVSMGQGISVRAGSGINYTTLRGSQCKGYCPNAASSVQLGQAVYSQEAYGQTEDVTKRGVNALGRISGVLTGDSFSRKDLLIHADPQHYQRIAMQMLTAANGTLTDTVQQARAKP